MSPTLPTLLGFGRRRRHLREQELGHPLLAFGEVIDREVDVAGRSSSRDSPKVIPEVVARRGTRGAPALETSAPEAWLATRVSDR